MAGIVNDAQDRYRAGLPCPSVYGIADRIGEIRHRLLVSTAHAALMADRESAEVISARQYTLAGSLGRTRIILRNVFHDAQQITSRLVGPNDRSHDFFGALRPAFLMTPRISASTRLRVTTRPARMSARPRSMPSMISSSRAT